MKRKNTNYLDFEMDKLTRSIENVITGDSFPTEILNFSTSDLAQVTKKNDWLFDWRSELKFNDGFVSFRAKTKLIEHYEKTLGANHFGGHLMILNTDASKKLIVKYFKS